MPISKLWLHVIKVIWQIGRIADTHGRFNDIHHVVSVCTPRNTCFLGPTRVNNPNGMSIGSAVFAQLTAEHPDTLQWAAPSHGRSAPPHNTWFLGPDHNPNDILIGLAIFAGLTSSTDRQTYRLTANTTHLVTTGCICTCSTAMRPKNAHISCFNRKQYLEITSQALSSGQQSLSSRSHWIYSVSQLNTMQSYRTFM